MTISPGEKLRRAREKKGLSQEQLAALLSIGLDRKVYQSFINKVETEVTNKVEFELLKRWCKTLDVDANEFLGLKAR